MGYCPAALTGNCSLNMMMPKAAVPIELCDVLLGEPGIDSRFHGAQYSTEGEEEEVRRLGEGR